MTSRGRFIVSGLAGLYFAATAMHWLISPIDRPDASGGRITGVWVTLVAGAALALWSMRQYSRAK
ncbi:MAG TPA: hypothetical protein VID74_01075 [Gemmatimonadales bacterium]